MTAEELPAHVATFRAAIWNKKVAAVRKQLADDPSLANYVWLTGEAVRTPLLEAVEKKHAPMVAVLLAGGADPNFVPPADPNGETFTLPLVQAASNGDAEIVDLLLKGGAQTEKYLGDRSWVTPLNFALLGSFTKPDAKLAVAKALIAAGANVDGNPPYAPLSDAAAYGFTAGLDLLAEAGARLSPAILLSSLKMAIQTGYAKADCFEWLLTRGIDPAAAFPQEELYADAAGLSFAELARRSGNPNAADFFEKRK